MSHLTTLASLPAGAGFAASLPAEKNEQPEAVQMKAPYFEGPEETAFPPADPHSGGLVGNGGGVLIGDQGPELLYTFQAGKLVRIGDVHDRPPVTVTITNTVGDVATVSSQVQAAVAGSERRIAAMIARSSRYGGCRMNRATGPEELPGDMDEEGAE